jgi:cell wall-associated NlpC family hydrolase
LTRYRRRRRRGRPPAREAAAAAAAGIILAAVAHHGSGPAAGAHLAAARGGHRTPAVVAAAIGYARAQLGKPYAWGGTGPGAFDCSGLVMMAYRDAGITLPRTSWQQWAAGPQVNNAQPGDLVFFAGSDGTTAAPGHVGLVIGNHRMIEAYATGYPVRISAFGDSAAAPGDGDPAGFTRPAARAGAG